MSGTSNAGDENEIYDDTLHDVPVLVSLNSTRRDLDRS